MAIFVTIISLLPGFAWLYFFLQEAPHPEPKWPVVRTFLFGMASAIIALAAQLALLKTSFIGDLTSYTYASSVGFQMLFSLLVFAGIEEIVKFGAAYFAVHKDPNFDEPVDAMIYMIVAALGFATVENLFAIASGGASYTASASSVFQTTSFRFVGATLLHTLASGLVGFYWAKSIRQFGRTRHLVVGLILATALHAVFNYFILSYAGIFYSLAFVIIVGFFLLNDFETLKGEIV
jgi:protease PrsW